MGDLNIAIGTFLREQALSGLSISGFSLILFLVYSKYYFADQFPMSGDAVNFITELTHAANAVAGGEFPLWNKWLAGGVSFLPSITVTFLLGILPIREAIYALYIGMLALGGTFFFLYLREIGCRCVVSYGMSLLPAVYPSRRCPEKPHLYHPGRGPAAGDPVLCGEVFFHLQAQMVAVLLGDHGAAVLYGDAPDCILYRPLSVRVPAGLWAALPHERQNHAGPRDFMGLRKTMPYCHETVPLLSRTRPSPRARLSEAVCY